ncbi:hypothetical protein B0T21DRAFT_402988 [Apiosordaria backusii]|uniref:Uncharacterized protein n=1 Tax=Apiosordaria backusii TaxID=314023 RepID=A0AA40E6Q3_9PEZI|nr:hypothetical protein B0T21DRAFT_402988 [Apiosordaria backusii]
MSSSQNAPNIPAAKRRRVEAANATLKKSFRSPMINRQSQQSPGTTSAINATPTQNSPSLTRSINHLSRPSTSIPVTPSRPAAPSPLRLGSASTARRSLLLQQQQKSFQPVSSPSPLKQRQQKSNNGNDEGDELLQRIQRSHRDLDQHMKKLEKELELVRQAKRIEQASRRKRPGEEIDIELKELIAKWKGPVGRQRRSWDGEEREGYECEEHGRERDEEGDRKSEEEEDDTEGFTMLMMLKSLNIELEVLGWDPGEEKWKD